MNRFRVISVALICAALSLFSLGCPYDGPHYPTTYGIPTSTPTPAPLTASITIFGSAYSPAAVTIFHGGTVTWVNNDGYPHTIYPSIGAGACGTDNPIAGVTGGVTATVTLPFPAATTVYFHCSIHAPTCTCVSSCTGMVGTIVIQ